MINNTKTPSVGGGRGDDGIRLSRDPSGGGRRHSGTGLGRRALEIEELD